MKINMSEKFETTEIDKKQFMYLEKTGPFIKSAPLAWQEFWQKCSPLVPQLSIDKMAGLSRIDESKNDDSKYIYQAGIFLNGEIKNVPDKISIRQTQVGKYVKFLLTGSYNQLAHAYPFAFSLIEKAGIKLRNDFCMEIYLNTPQDVKEEELKTEILIPIQ